MPRCQCNNPKKNGRNRHGVQRYKCRVCGVCWQDGIAEEEQRRGGNFITQEKDNAIKAMLSLGMSYREIQRVVGVHTATIAARTPPKNLAPPVESAKRNECDYCGSTLTTEKEFHRKSARSKHKFCDRKCYVDFRRYLCDRRRCSMCGVRSGELTSRKLVKGKCPACYQMFRKYKDEKLAACARLQVALTQEIITSKAV